MDVIAQLGQAAGFTFYEKQAAPNFGSFFRWLGSMGQRAAGGARVAPAAVRAAAPAAATATRAAAPAATAAPGRLRQAGSALFGTPRRAALTTAVGVPLGASVGRNAYENAYYDHSEGLSANPFRGFGLFGARGVGPSSPEEAFQRNQARLLAMSDPIERQMNEAMARGDHTAAERLRGQLMRGDVPGGRSLLDPFTWLNGPGAGYHQQMANTAQGTLQRQYDQAMRQATMQPGDPAAYDNLIAQLRRPGLLPQQARLIQQQAEQIRLRLRRPAGLENTGATAIRQRMEGNTNDPSTQMRVIRPPVDPSVMRAHYLENADAANDPGTQGSLGGNATGGGRVDPRHLGMTWSMHDQHRQNPYQLPSPEQLNPHIQVG